MVQNKGKIAIIYAMLAATLYAISSPFSKILLEKIPPTLMASLLYIGAGLGMLIINVTRKFRNSKPKEAKMTRKELPYSIGMIVLDIFAPILLMLGLLTTPASNASLLNNFEIVATAIIALFIFKESIGKKMWFAIILVTLSSIILSFENINSFKFSFGSILIILACLCWGLENNCTRMLSLKDPLQIVAIKGFGAGIGALLIAIIKKEYSNDILFIILTLFLGFFAYGLSIYFYIKAQRELGATRTSAYYAVAPFIGVALSLIIFKNELTLSFIIALLIMILGTYLTSAEKHNHEHIHEKIEHEHRHSHNDGHHNHIHDYIVEGEHSHIHMHEEITHKHRHTPDMHHKHLHT